MSDRTQIVATSMPHPGAGDRSVLGERLSDEFLFSAPFRPPGWT
jgi:hypothetical protein